VRSATVTAKLAAALLPALSLAAQRTVVAPIGNAVPEAGRQLAAPASPEIPSVAVGTA
jgi:hypothetical protein